MQNQGQIVFNKPQEFGNHRKLDEMVSRSQRILLKIYTMFPFDPFPDCLTIDENKVNFVSHELGTERLHTVFIENISYVTVDTIPFSATLNITDSTSERFPVLLQIKWLKKEDAFRARRLIHGLMAAKRTGIDFSVFDKNELIIELEKLGEAREAE